MSDSVVRLVAERKGMLTPCETCAYFHPASMRDITWNWLRRLLRKPEKFGADSIHYAMCGAYGGGFAHIEREYRCHGNDWSPKTI